MGVILNEKEWAESAIRDRDLGDNPYMTIKRVSRYYLDLGYTKKNARAKIDEFVSSCDPTISLVIWKDMMDKAFKRACKSGTIIIDNITVTDKEIEKINMLNGVQIKRLAFTMLCLSKYWNAVNATDSNWVGNEMSEIMKLANINTSIKRQTAMYHDLIQNGMIQMSRRVDNTNVKVMFGEEGETVLTIYDFRNLGYQYLKYAGEPFFECQCCGIVTKYEDPVHHKYQKYCRDCASEMKIKQNVNSVMRHRETIKKSIKLS